MLLPGTPSNVGQLGFEALRGLTHSRPLEEQGALRAGEKKAVGTRDGERAWAPDVGGGPLYLLRVHEWTQWTFFEASQTTPFRI